MDQAHISSLFQQAQYEVIYTKPQIRKNYYYNRCLKYFNFSQTK